MLIASCPVTGHYCEKSGSVFLLPTTRRKTDKIPHCFVKYCHDLNLNTDLKSEIHNNTIF